MVPTFVVTIHKYHTRSSNYLFIVINPDGCRKTALLELIVNPQPNVTTVVTNEVCDNENNGSVTVSTTSTGGSYEYRITSTAFPI
ncbi:MAG: hypothetical protein IPF52_14405 [Saprospiraceae bacterium]|nr:hypothetical protein [Saprospiraceae bacterium]